MFGERKNICTNSTSSYLGLILSVILEMSSKLAGNGKKHDL